MPPKPKFTKEEIIEAATDIVAENGVDALTARELGSKLNSSARPIFTVFSCMEDLFASVRSAAMKRFENFIPTGVENLPYFKQIGMKTIQFAIKQPKLFQLLFMRENSAAVNFDGVFVELGVTAEKCVQSICLDYALSDSKAKLLFENVWIYTFGLGVLCATGACKFSERDIGEMLTTEFCAMLSFVKGV